MRILAKTGIDARGERERLMVTVEGGRIASLDTWDNETRPQSGDLDARNSLILPGFLDIHIHGGVGRNVMEATPESLDAISVHLSRHGVTGFLATTITGPLQTTQKALAVTAQRMREGSTPGARVLGCHLEGPYINAKKKGAQPEQFILPPDVEAFEALTGAHLDAVKVMTLAPEMPGALKLIRWMAERGIVASLGHTNATYAEVSAAIDAGARHVTHCFNAMRPLEGREPGVVGAALARPELTAELIWDNIHVHPASCRALVNAKGAEGVILISDGIPGTGMPEGYRFTLGDLPILVDSGTARLPDGTLAGSLLTLDLAFHNARAFSLPERSRMSSYNAAKALGLSHRLGLLAPGYDADLALLGENSQVTHTIVGGRQV